MPAYPPRRVDDSDQAEADGVWFGGGGRRSETLPNIQAAFSDG
ncbi:MAG: hypothetical protein U9R15_04655 [Chloroflexota bacterium]|nr:hypothetical protein [Chloroflexota bacterium]